MKRLYILLCLLVPILLSAQTLTPFCHRNGKWGYEGYVKGKKKAVIRPKFESVRKFHGSYAFVCHKGRWGIIGKDGKFVVEPKYDGVGVQEDSYTIVRLGNKYGILDGIKLSVPFKYDELKFLDDSYAYSRIYDAWGVVELYGGRQTVPVQYNYIRIFESDYLLACIGGKYELFSRTGRKITSDLYDNISLYEGKFFKVKQGDKLGLLDLSGKQVAAVQYDDISLYENNFLKVKQSDKQGLLSLSGSVIANTQYDDISLYERNFLKVRQGLKFGLLNLAGGSIAAVQYDAISLYENRFLKVQQGDKLGLLDTSGKSIANVEYDNISLLGNRFLKVTQSHKCGLLNTTGTPIVAVKYDEIAMLGSRHIKVRLDWKWGVLDLSGETLVATEYDTIEQIANGKYLLKSNTPCLVDTQGSIYRNLMLYTSSNRKIVEPRYSDCIDANIVLNAYYGNIGIMAFDKPITKITNGAFMYCDTLTDITIPESVTTVAGDIFKGCTSLPVIDGFRYAGTYLVERVDKYRASYTIKSGTRFVGDNALDFSFEENDRLNMSRSLTAPDTIIFVGDGNNLCCIVSDLNVEITDLKRHCENPISLIASANGDGDSSCVTLYIDGEKVRDLVIPDGVKKIARMAFGSCFHFDSITIPSSVKEVESYAFHFTCVPVIYCKHTIPPTGFSPGSFYGELDDGPEPNYFKIYVPRKSVAAYKRAKGWSYFAPGIFGYDFNTTKPVPANKPRPASER